MNTNKKHYWTDQERKFISRCYIEEYVLKQCGIKKDYFVARMCHFFSANKRKLDFDVYREYKTAYERIWHKRLFGFFVAFQLLVTTQKRNDKFVEGV